MRTTLMSTLSVFLGVLTTSSVAVADDVMAQVQVLSTQVQQLTSTVELQQKQINDLHHANQDLRSQLRASPRSVAAQAQSQQGRANTYGMRGGLQAFNPEIGVVADIVGQLSELQEDAEGNDKISVRELELVFGHDVDPYSRFDATVTFSDFEEPGIEEAYITHWGLPWELRGRLGRFRPKIGKANLVHRHALDTIDAPLVVQQYLGVEGYFKTGGDVSWMLPMPYDHVVHELTAGLLEGGIGEGGTLLGSNRRRPTFYTHLKNFWEVSADTNMELGGTWLVGSKDDDERFEANAFGVDATLVHHVTPNNALKWQNEAYVQDRDETASGVSEMPWGMYSLLDYRLLPRWNIGMRYDYVRPVDVTDTVRHADTAWNAYLTFHQSEFARWRIQYQHRELAAGNNDDRLMLQGTFAIGVHKHQLQ